jgi:hypothetical protein
MTPEEFFACTGGMYFVLKDFDAFGSNEMLGHVRVSLDDLLNGTGERVEYKITPEREFKDAKSTGKLFLRFREASEDDIEFMDVYKQNADKLGVYVNETFLSLRAPDLNMLRRLQKRGLNKEHLFRVRPFPDPAREEETTWMTKEQIFEESMKPSTHWVEAGSGQLGRVYVEVLGCEKLPNMDAATLNLRDRTDAFACLVYEDSIVTTDVIGDTLSPRWMPWCRRGFVFNVSHPSSDLQIGLFDFDPELSPLQIASRATGDLHDPIGRVQVNLSNFPTNTVLTLCYPM